MFTRTCRTLSNFVIVSFVAAFGVMPAWSQIPEKFTNLQVLPKEIGKGELLDVMKGFTRGLGVRCPYCHVGEEGEALDEL